MTKVELKKYIQENCINKENGKRITARCTISYFQNRGLYNDLMTLYDDSSCLHETIYRLLNNIDIRPACKICGNTVYYSKQHGFSTHCSPKCSNNDPEVLAKNKAGVSKALKAVYAERGDEIKKKRAKTLTGDENGSCSPFSLKSCQEKIKQTNLERYGVDNVFRLKTLFDRKEINQNRTKELWKSRGIDVDYDGPNVIVHNACPIHKDILIPINVFQARWRRCPKNDDGTPNIEYLCRECHPMYMTGIEKIVDDILKSTGIEYSFRDKQQIKPYELDFYIPSRKLGIECNGIYWHSLEQKDSDYYKIKYDLCQENQITLLSIWEDDAYTCPNLIKALIMSGVLGYKEEYWDNVHLEEIVKSSIFLLNEYCPEYMYHLQMIVDEFGVRIYAANKVCQYIWLNDNRSIPYNKHNVKQLFNADTINITYSKELDLLNKMHQRENGKYIECSHIGYIQVIEDAV